MKNKIFFLNNCIFYVRRFKYIYTFLKLETIIYIMEIQFLHTTLVSSGQFHSSEKSSQSLNPSQIEDLLMHLLLSSHLKWSESSHPSVKPSITLMDPHSKFACSWYSIYIYRVFQKHAHHKICFKNVLNLIIFVIIFWDEF